ncbi:tyrosine-protein phosphatase pmp1 [Pyricularia oryzae 70-15]|uniref:protein-tyrosine-phosphatase n=2 Tax=Pyricularia oryzae TaxID=318829 RepID=G4N549_PYRO7|nr:tyrosine-protein phosphatase pmp1 [Pyricularia oryzae 70-15]EHA52960.1 tyrosine-protein phosphatase pmp1 [Pyricularia oryzae 70-15]ELQ38804.1 tyrosine-protein phosphatase pmp1 [Pyricularia oryzae Y34]KAI7915150.1 tyrosine-protein phosphatase pmp1 [Pyricularia oryzae]KAI7916863.1 tyrosine-protein phosphatase pmp1 [Pyricularia oryzae]
MPSAASRRLYEDQIPSFMSVFDLDSELMSDHNTITVVDAKMMDMDATQPKISSQQKQQPLHPAALPSDPQHKHHDSTSTQMTESSDSSPTTTASCTDSSSLSDQSPSSSPDSPVNLIPLSSFAGPTFGGLSSMATLNVSEPTTLVRPMTSPGPRRPRNMKGLSIQPPFASNSLASTLASEPSSPSFIKPTIPAMKRKPSNLSLKTGSHDLVKPTLMEIPASPTLAMPPMLQRRALKHSTSSPHMLQGLKSSTFGPAGGMTIPTVLERNESGLSEFLRPSKPNSPPAGATEVIPEEGSPIRAQVANRAAFDIEPFREIENNEDQKSPGYPEGPIAIYEDNVFLYSEPNAEEASRFDVVINVAREVQNPFEVAARKARESERSKDMSPIPDTACSFATAFEYFPAQEDSATPTTPKAAAHPLKEPEYIHMLWDHNTDIAPDLMGLCEIIDRKTKEGKKVLIHCQQGASRSASLIIAYGMYQRPELNVNDAYHAAQARSRWISPNMRLMYCLQDFQKENAKKRLTPGSAFRPRTGKSPTKHRVALSVDAIDLPVQKEPLTAPLPGDDGATDSPERSPLRPRGNSTPNCTDPVSAGPSSAPSSFSWSEKEDEKDLGKFGRFNVEGIFRPAQPDSGFVSSSSLGSSAMLRPPPSPGFPKPPLSPGFAPPSFSKPPPSPGFAPMNFSRPPPSPGFAPLRLSKTPPPAPLGGLAPITLSRPPLSPGFAPPAFGKPPPSPGFGAHRFEKRNNGAGFGGFGGFVPMHLPEEPSPVEEEHQQASPERHVPILPAATFEDDDALMSPRVETMTNNPLHDPFGSDFAGLRLVEQPPTPNDGLFSPRATVFPRDPFRPFARPTQVADPRSPPTKGETPIVRSIDELI